MSKQTAVQWLFTLMVDPNYPIAEQKKWLEQAKQMEKAQHADTWLDSRIESNDKDYIGKEKSFEQYYNETYGK
jgi:hypothetical protein